MGIPSVATGVGMAAYMSHICSQQCDWKLMRQPWSSFRPTMENVIAFFINIFHNIAVLDVSRTGRTQSVFQHPVALSSYDFSGGTRAPRFIDIQAKKKGNI